MQDSDVLIAAMLAAEEDQLSNPYFDDTFDNCSKSDEEDYNPFDTGRPKKKLKSAKMLKKVGSKARNVWSADEEEIFLRGLDTHGRDWRKISKMLGSRDSNSVRSHAQRHFIRLWYENKDLPAKVQESGKGHTLSGKPLDPESAAAKCFLKNKPRKGNKFWKIDLKSTSAQPTGIKSGRQMRHISKKKGSGKRKTQPIDQAWVATQKVISRRSRSKRRRSNLSHRAICGKIDSAEPHDLHQFQFWNSEFGMDQPFQVAVSPLAMAMADFHAHMSTNEEVIGLLVGSWDKKTRSVRVSCAKPCAHLDNGEDTSINVEMDPVSEMGIREWIETEEASTVCGVLKPIVVGWYHSHPVFEPIPSTKDIENNLRYQQLLENPKCDNSPFLGLILGPWDIRMLDMKSVQNWFVVKKVDGISNNERGFPMKIDIKLDNEGVTISQVSYLKLEMSKLAEKYRASLNFDTLWRNFVYVKGADGKIRKEDGSVTRLEKLKGSLKADLQDLDDKVSESFITEILLLVSNKF